MKKSLFNLAFIFALLSANANAAKSSVQRGDYLAPIGVMRDHTHKKGEFMASYRFSQTYLNELRDADDEVLDQNSLYNSNPDHMILQRHVYGLMYGLTDNITISATGSYSAREIQIKAGDNDSVVNMEVADIGDTNVNVLYKILSNDKVNFQLNLGLGLPTGENSEYDSYIDNQRMKYIMQSGSGSYEFLPGLSYTNYQDDFSFGAQINANFRLNSNDNGYKFGDEYSFTSWIAKEMAKGFVLSARAEYNIVEGIDGQDPQFVDLINFSPVYNPNLGDGSMLYGFGGASYKFDSGYFKGQRIAVEFGAPLYQKIDGPMLQDRYKFIIGWQRHF